MTTMNIFFQPSPGLRAAVAPRRQNLSPLAVFSLPAAASVSNSAALPFPFPRAIETSSARARGLAKPG